MQLAHCLASVKFYSSYADANFLSNLPVEPTGNDEGNHLVLTRCESGEDFTNSGDRAFTFAQGVSSLDCCLDCVEQILMTNWFGQEFYGASLHSPDGHWNVGVTADKDYWNVRVSLGELVEEVNSASPWQSHIEDQTIERLFPVVTQEFLH